MKKFICLFISLFIFINVSASTKVYLFYGNTCPRCAEFKAYINKNNFNYDIEYYEVYDNIQNNELLKKVAQTFNDERYGVPYIVVGNQRVIGWNDTLKEQFHYIVSNNNGCDIVDSIINEKNNCRIGINLDGKVKVPLLGYVSTSSASIGLIGMLIGIIDGFNPICLFALIYLLTNIKSKNKKRTFITGFMFILMSSIIYFLIMELLVNVISINYINILNYIIGFILIICSLYNLYKFIKFDKNSYKKESIMKRIGSICSEKKLLYSIIGILSLAVILNIVSIPSSLGLPLTYSAVLALNNLSFIERLIFTSIYIIFYMIDDLIIFLLILLDFNISEEKYIKYSYFVCFILMIIMGILLFIKPSLLIFNASI